MALANEQLDGLGFLLAAAPAKPPETGGGFRGSRVASCLVLSFN